MNCELYDDLVDDYVDGLRGDGRLAAFEQHLAGCSRCQGIVADLSSIRLTAAALDEHVPPPRLWGRIASAIDDRQRRPWWQRQVAGVFSAWVPVTAAAVVVLVAAGLWNARPQKPVDAPAQVGASPSEPEPIPAEQHYEQAIAGLQQLADAQNAALDPETRAVLTRNLAVIDRAISESRAALAQEPASTLAQESLLDALETKVALLQDTVALATDSGLAPEEAAGAAKGLNQ
jgi:hypothetical protein